MLRYVTLAIVIVGLLASPALGFTGLDWDDNTEPDLQDYQVYSCTTWPCDTGTGTLEATVTVSDWTPGGNLPNDTCYFVTARDTSLNESGESNVVETGPSQVCPPADTTPPAAPVNLQLVTASSGTTVDFDNPVPATGCGAGELLTLHQGIDFGSNWGCWGTTNFQVTFATSGPTSESFSFVTPAILQEVTLVSDAAGDATVDFSDNNGQTASILLPAGQTVTLTTGWSQASTTVTMTTPAGWNNSITRLEYQ